MTLRVTLNLTDRDLRHFSRMAKQARAAAGQADEAKVIKSSRNLLANVRDVKGVDFISDRLGKLEVLIAMLEDEDWAMPKADRDRVLSALTYFVNPEDLIQDHIPGLGFLDDAIMIELICRELKHEIEAYTDFLRFRKSELGRRAKGAAAPGRDEFVQRRRQELLSRMRRRRRRDFGRGGSGGRSPFSLF